MDRINNALPWLRRKWWLFAILLVGYWLIGACLFHTRFLIAEGPAPASFRDLPGTLAVSPVVADGNQKFGRYFLLRSGNFVEVGSIGASMTSDAPLPLRPARIGGLKIYPGDPYRTSPDGLLAAVATETNFPSRDADKWNRTESLLIFELATGKLVTRVDAPGEWYIRSIAWSPDNRYVAATRLKLNMGDCLLEKIVFMIGHPGTTASYALDILDLTGDRVASIDLASHVNWMGVDLVWGDAELASESLGDVNRARAAEQRNRARQAYQ